MPESVPISVIREIADRFPDARQILISGSHIKGCATSESDIDVFVFLPRVSEVLREVARVDGHLVDLAVHDFRSIRVVLTREHAMSICALADELEQGVFLIPPCDEALALKALCRAILEEGPKPFDLDALRSHLLGQSSDLRHCLEPTERHAIALGLAFKLMLLEVRARGGWIGSGRYLARDLDRLAPGFIDALAQASSLSLAGQGDKALIDQVETTIRRHFGTIDRRWHCRVQVD
ncbi:hypothetical protein CDN99_12925 [Roseateles aquatilis]|uniref:Polymerase nucleotidyl transferase domain-containing protein n=1 Tax=Roseateles aquatilis TaxID=431061 RepID=A0A246JC78_9BURK|nr:hypothetical protein CDN99_12925 [Roseateles aquatilis]